MSDFVAILSVGFSWICFMIFSRASRQAVSSTSTAPIFRSVIVRRLAHTLFMCSMGVVIVISIQYFDSTNIHFFSNISPFFVWWGIVVLSDMIVTCFLSRNGWRGKLYSPSLLVPFVALLITCPAWLILHLSATWYIKVLYLIASFLVMAPILGWLIFFIGIISVVLLHPLMRLEMLLRNLRGGWERG